jgi:hypothetical protein
MNENDALMLRSYNWVEIQRRALITIFRMKKDSAVAAVGQSWG